MMLTKEKELALLVILSWVLIYLIYISNSPNIFKVSSVVIMLYVIGRHLEKKFSLEKELQVFLLWKDKKYIGLLKKIAIKMKNFFIILSDASLFIAFGLLAFKIIKWRTIKEKIILGFIGYTLLISLSMIYGPSISLLMVILGIRAKASAGSLMLSIFPYLTLLFGLATTSFIALLISSFSILLDIINYLVFGAKEEIIQGATLLLPGINIPFLEGILALVIILIVHEFSHGILAIIEKIKVKSMGVVSFGTLPIGAFVEPDEEILNKAPKKSISRVLIAGVSANFLTSLLFFVLLLVFIKLTIPFSEESCLLITGNKAIQVKYQDFCILNNYAETINGEIIELNGQVYSLKLSEYSLIKYYRNPVLQFIYNLLMLSTSLNLVIGIINLIPIPFFDGDSLSKTFIPDKLHKIIRYTALFALLISLLPGIL